MDVRCSGDRLSCNSLSCVKPLGSWRVKHLASQQSVAQVKSSDRVEWCGGLGWFEFKSDPRWNVYLLNPWEVPIRHTPWPESVQDTAAVMVTGQHWRRSPRTQLFQNEVRSLRSHKLQPPGEASTDIYSIRFWMVDPSKPTSPWRIRSSVLFRKRTFLSPNWSHVLICSGIPGNTACRNPKSQVQKNTLNASST